MKFDEQLALLRDLAATGAPVNSPDPELSTKEREALAELLRRWDELNAAVQFAIRARDEGTPIAGIEHLRSELDVWRSLDEPYEEA